MSRHRIAIAIGAVLLVGGIALAATRWRIQVGSGSGSVIVPRDPCAGARARAAATRIRVQVLNATRQRGLARRATMFLRDCGFDVVENGTISPVRETTVVYDRSGHPDWARLVASTFTGAVVESRPDSSHYVDVTVLVGAAWRPPAQPFYP
ncbi:MAG: LytR C-terminal domain-containing protein [Gemmatimonadota bacterium]|nr:LytR C-terminal domain-containing protein [Gemmatimonadota bacterium]